jgi:CAAX protease family protein
MTSDNAWRQIATFLTLSVALCLPSYYFLISQNRSTRSLTSYGLAAFSVSFMAFSFALAWLRLKSGSVWTAVILHASHNLFIQNVFDRLTVSRGATQYVTTEFGVGLAVVYTAAAVACWRRRAELSIKTMTA